MFVLSTGIFGLPSILGLTRRWGFNAYLWVCGAILVGFLILALAIAICRGPYSHNEPVEVGFPFFINVL